MPAPMAAPRAGELDAETTVAAAPATVSDSCDRGQGAVVARGGGASRAWMPAPTAAPTAGELDAETAPQCLIRGLVLLLVVGVLTQ